MKALITEKHQSGVITKFGEWEDDALGDGDVLVRVEYSALNYKDALALTGRGGIMQHYPLIGGIDLAGIVETSDSALFKTGDRVLANGWGLSQTHNGGFAERARVPAEWLIPVPDALSTRDAMAIGTAGYTAMLCVLALERSGLTPGSGNILVSGANGGVGSIAIALLSELGYRVIAATGRTTEKAYLETLGAAEILDREELSAPGRLLGKERWAGAVDSVGSHTLTNILAQTRYGGAVAACGLAQGMDLPASVAPFIIRGVTLAGIDSVHAPRDRRLEAWSRLASDLDRAKLAAVTSEVGLADVQTLAAPLLDGKVQGRTVVKIL